jgi:hypothetical protein
MVKLASCIWAAIILFGFLTSNSIALDSIVVGAPYETVGANIYQGRAYVFDTDTGAPLISLTTPNPQQYGTFGTSVSSGDLNGDGKDDVIVGAPGEVVYTITQEGRAYVFDGNTGVCIRTLTTPNPLSHAHFGYSVSSGDVDGNGKDDIIVGAPDEREGYNDDQGRVYVFEGETGIGIRWLSTPNPQVGAHFGYSVSSGDVDGNGKDDVIVGACSESVGTNWGQGRAYVFDGNTGVCIRTLTTPNPESPAYFGYSVSSGDVDGNGKDDIIVGALNETIGATAHQGRAYVFDGNTGVCIRTLTTPNPQSHAHFGYSVSSGDVDGNGKDDVIVGAPYETVGTIIKQGHAYVFDGNTGVCIRTLTTPNPQVGANFGWSVSVTADRPSGWEDLGGVVLSNPSMIKDSQGRTHIFVKGGDNALWDNLDGTWQYLGGIITSDPYAVKDSLGAIHVLVRGGDNALWDRVVGSGWTYLGGAISSSPSAALSTDNHIKVAVKGSDNAIWMKDITTGSWTSLGGVITSDPQAIRDANGKMHVLARGGDNALWDNINGVWTPLGGAITSDPMPLCNPSNPGYIYTFVRGGDGSLWRNDLDIGTNSATWHGLGGVIAPNGGSIDLGNPAPVTDVNGVVHAFVQGMDGSLWDNAGGNWQGLGGVIKSSPNAIRDGAGWLQVAAVGGDDALWVYRLAPA